MPGDILLKEQGETPEQTATHPHPFYTPVATFGSEYMMEPVAYGLMFAGMFSGGTFLEGDFTSKLQATGVDATAYAAILPSGHAAVIVLNKDAERGLEFNIHFGTRRRGEIETVTLHAPALEAREAHLTRSPTSSRLQNGKYTVTVPHATGVCLTLR